MTRSRFEKQIRFLQNQLSPEGYAGLHLTVGVFIGANLRLVLRRHRRERS
jgi:hypothetical protein